MKYNFDKILSDFSKIKGFVLSNISHLKLLEKYSDKYEFIANYTFNIFNDLMLSEEEDSDLNQYIDFSKIKFDEKDDNDLTYTRLFNKFAKVYL